VLWVKGSGGDLANLKTGKLLLLYQDKLIALQQIYQEAGTGGPKTPIEDRNGRMIRPHDVQSQPAGILDRYSAPFVCPIQARRSHPSQCRHRGGRLKESEALTRKIYGGEVIWTPWQRPGFDLGLQLQEICRRNPNAKGAILGQHGLINWGQ